MTTLKQTPEIINNLILREINNTLADIAASLKIIATRTAFEADVPQDNFATGFNQLVEERYLDAHLLGDNNLGYSFRGIKNNKETEN